MGHFGTVPVVFSPAPGPLDNPLKGYAAYSETGVQHSVPSGMAFVETSWKVLEPKEGDYRFADWEAHTWETPLAKGKPIVFRVFLDYPSQPVGVPDWLVKKGLKLTPYTEFGGGMSPDYQNPDLQKGVLKLIQELGKRYDSNPRVAFIQVGLLGYWGEWHTYPREELFASGPTQRMVLSALHAAFPHKQLMARNAEYLSAREPWLGYHDDMIPADTLGPDRWDFYPTLQRAGRADNWKVAPVGGEMVPGQAAKYLGSDWANLLKAVETTHITWIGPYSPPLFSSPDPDYKLRSESLIRKMGYEFCLRQGILPKGAVAKQPVTIQLDGVNQGVAPFYYPWQLELVLLADDGQVAIKTQLNDDIRTWLPGPFKISGKVTPLMAGHYRVGLGIIDPMSGKPGIRFANDLPVVNGYTVLYRLSVN